MKKVIGIMLGAGHKWGWSYSVPFWDGYILALFCETQN